jgi:hypothetical protein
MAQAMEVGKDWEEGDIFRLKSRVSSLSLLTSEVRALSAARRPRGQPTQYASKLASSLLSVSATQGLQKTDKMIGALRPQLLETEERITQRIDQLKKIAEGDLSVPAKDTTETDPTASSSADDLLGLLATTVPARVDLSTNYIATEVERTVWMGGWPDHLAGGSAVTLEKSIRYLLTEQGYGDIQSIKPRYKDPGAEGSIFGVGSGHSWCFATFYSMQSASALLDRGVEVQGDLPTGVPPSAARRPVVRLSATPVDPQKAAKSPVGVQALEKRIQGLEGALVRYKKFLPVAHPTLLRILSAIAHAHELASNPTSATDVLRQAVDMAKALKVQASSMYKEDHFLVHHLLSQTSNPHAKEVAMAAANARPSRQWVD